MSGTSNFPISFPQFGQLNEVTVAPVTFSFRQSLHLQTIFLPPSFPLFATGFPSASTMSKAKSILGAFLTEVPTPNPSAPAVDKPATVSSLSPPETKIFTWLYPLESSSHLTSRMIPANFPRLELALHRRTPSGPYPSASAAKID